MIHLRKFFESVEDRPTHKLDIEDFEDLLLELTDIGYKIIFFRKGWVNADYAEYVFDRPAQGMLIAYTMKMVNLDNMQHLIDGPTDLRSIQEEAQRSKFNFEKIISCLKKIEYSLGKVIISNLENIYSFNISVIEKGTTAISVSEKESQFYEFYYKVKQVLGETIRATEYEIVEDIKAYSITITFADGVTRSRFNTAINNIKTIKKGIRNYLRTNKIGEFDIESSFANKSVVISFNSYMVNPLR